MKAHTAQRLLGALAFTLSITSTLTPFLQTIWAGGRIPEVFPGPEYLWSFRYTMEHYDLNTGLFYNEWWFTDFWSQAWYISVFKQPFFQYVGPVLVTMFLTQILAVLFGSLSILKPNPVLLLLSTILSVATIFSMSFIIQALSNSYVKTIHTGYILAIASTALFLTVFIWKVTSRKQQTNEN